VPVSASASETIMIRTARGDERAWANERYREIRFAPTTPADLQLFAVAGGQPVGLGRLVRIAPDAVELGGIWTAEFARGRGVASLMVSTLLDHARTERTVWCVPFRHLSHFYLRFGFAIAPPPWPSAIDTKVVTCRVRGQDVETLAIFRPNLDA